MAEAEDLPSLLAPEALKEADELTQVGEANPADVEVAYVLGWFRWFQHLALREGPNGENLLTAVRLLTPCYAFNDAPFPEQLRPVLARAACIYAQEFLRRTSEIDDHRRLDAVVTFYRRAVRDLPESDPLLPYLLSDLSEVLRMRFEQHGDPADLEEALNWAHKAVERSADDSLDKANALMSLSRALYDRMSFASDSVSLRKALSTMELALDVIPDQHPMRVMVLANHGTALLTKFWAEGNGTDLDRAIEQARDALDRISSDGSDHGLVLSTLGSALRARHGLRGDLQDLEQALRYSQQAAEVIPHGHYARAETLSIYCQVLQTRSQTEGGGRYLNEAVTVARRALASATNAEDRGEALAHLCASLWQRYSANGDTKDLDEAVPAGREAIRTIPESPHALNNASWVLRERHVRFGSLDDLDEAITYGRQGLPLVENGFSNHTEIVTQLGLAVFQRAQLRGADADWEESLTLLRRSEQLCPPGHAYRARALTNLSAILQCRALVSQELPLADEAIRHSRAAAALDPRHHVEHAHHEFGLSSALNTRNIIDGGSSLLRLTEAMDHALRVRDNLSEHVRGTPARAIYDQAVADCAYRLFDATGDLESRETAATHLTAVLDNRAAPVPWRLRAGGHAFTLLRGSAPEQAFALAERTVPLLSQLTPRRLLRSDQQNQLRGFTGMTAEAVALALTAAPGDAGERAERALKLSEAGRGVILTAAFKTLGELDDLRRVRPTLAQRLVRLREELDGEEISPATAAGLGGTPVRDRHGPALEYERLVEEIRGLDGFADFACPPSLEALTAEAADGPVVVLNASICRSDALVLTTEGVVHVPLPGLTVKECLATVQVYRLALHNSCSAEQVSERKRAQDTITEVLAWLWDHVTGPVLERLGFRSTPREGKWPRVWWVPCGFLSQLPIHAAGHHTDLCSPEHSANPRTVLDRVVSSYTPTVRALRYSREGARKRPGHRPGRGLVVAMPATPGLPNEGRLHYVDKEAEAVVHALAPDVAVLRGPDPDPAPAPGPSPSPGRSGGVRAESLPTRENVLRHLADASIAHFACHGTSDPDDPSRSRLLLHDHQHEPFTAAGLSASQFSGARLAYLSACGTAVNEDLRLSDESIHVASAFQLAGFAHVVGTMWQVDDQVAGLVAEHFYTNLRGANGLVDPDRAPFALHEAVRAVRAGDDLRLSRSKRVGTPVLWAAFSHTGA